MRNLASISRTAILWALMIFIIWFLLTSPYIRLEIKVLSLIPRIVKLKLSPKMKVLEDPFYSFCEVVIKNVSEKETVYFYGHLKSERWAYISGKANYYLYPRKVFIFDPEKMRIEDLPPDSFFVFYFHPTVIKRDIINTELLKIPFLKAVVYTQFAGIYQVLGHLD